MSKALIVYYSYSSNTRDLAEYIEKRIDGMLLELQPRIPYPISYDATVKQAEAEIKSSFRPELKNAPLRIESYDVIFIGTPNWFGTIAPPVAAFLEKYDFMNKKIFPFCTHGGGGAAHIAEAIQKLCPQTEVREPLAILEGTLPEEAAISWLQNTGLVQN